MMSLIDYYNRLESLRKPKPNDPYDNRVTHCYLVHNIEGEDHYFQVRGWNKIKDEILKISVVNRTCCAGTATIELTEELIPKFKIITVKERYEARNETKTN